MILIDANLLIYAHDAGNPFHEPTRGWLEGVLSGSDPVGLSWSGIQAFLRITTNPKIFDVPLEITEAVAKIETLLSSPVVTILDPGPRHWPMLRDLLRGSQIKGSLVTDAHLAALAIEHSAVLCTADRDFNRFEGLRTEYPLAEGEA